MDTLLIPLSHGKYALIDAEDHPRVAPYVWTIKRERRERASILYACRHDCELGRDDRITVYMHRLVVDAPEDMFVDHINGNTLDNRKSNLRICTFADNCRNRAFARPNVSGYRGVYQRSNSGTWCAQLRWEGRRYHLGCFPTPEQAARARDAKARELHGEYAWLNFPDDPQTQAEVPAYIAHEDVYCLLKKDYEALVNSLAIQKGRQDDRL